MGENIPSKDIASPKAPEAGVGQGTAGWAARLAPMRDGKTKGKDTAEETKGNVIYSLVG